MYDRFMLMCFVFFFNDTATTEIYTYLHTLSLHDALPISRLRLRPILMTTGAMVFGAMPLAIAVGAGADRDRKRHRSEEHTSELQSLMRISYAVFCLKKKKKKNNETNIHINNRHKNKLTSLNKYLITITQHSSLQYH